MFDLFDGDDSNDEPEDEAQPENVAETSDEDPREERQESEESEETEETEASEEDAEEVEEEEEEEEEELVTLVEEAEAAYEYTEHEAKVTYTDGSTEVYTFDVMNKNGQEIVLKDYSNEVDVSSRYGRLIAEPSKVLAFLTIERDELRTFETTDRRPEQKTAQVREEYEVTRSEAEEYVENNDRYYIAEPDGDDEDEA